MKTGLVDTNIVMHWPLLPLNELPPRIVISSVTLAELWTGVDLADNAEMRAERLDMLQRVESDIECIPFDPAAARIYGRIAAAATNLGRSPRARVADQMIAATAAAHGWPLYTTNPGDFAGLERILTVVPVARP